jgi:hypothetical protein
VATLDLGGFRRRYRADGHGRAAFDPEMMVALLRAGRSWGLGRSKSVSGLRAPGPIAAAGRDEQELDTAGAAESGVWKNR